MKNRLGWKKRTWLLLALCAIAVVSYVPVTRLITTARLITAEDSCSTCGVGAEIVARITERAMDYLEGIERVACPDTPAPFSPPLQKAYMPGRDLIVRAVKKILS